MEGFGEHCRLCLGAVNSEKAEEINCVTRDILEVILLKLNFDDRNKHVMCKVCSVKILEAFEFKSTCLYTDDVIIGFVDEETGSSADLKEIYAKVKGTKLLTGELENHKICRLCMQLIRGEFISVHKMEVDMFAKYIPEINFNVVRNPVICPKCFESFGAHIKFIENCLEVEKNSKSIQDTRFPSALPLLDSYIKTEIKTENTEVKFKTELEKDFIESNVTRSEDEVNLTKTECMETKSEQNNVQSDTSTDIFSSHELQHDNTSETKQAEHESPSDRNSTLTEQMYNCEKSDDCTSRRKDCFTCGKCDYETKHVDDLKRYQPVHVSPSEAQTYRCFTCGFETRHKEALKVHMARHTPLELQMYKCDTCNHQAYSRSNLKRHQLQHEDISKARKYKCDVCSFRTKTKDHLKVHQLNHKDPSEVPMYECEECGYKSKYKAGLKNHRLKHKDPSEVQMYTCDVCPYKTKHKYCLGVHKLIHMDSSEVQMFKCFACNFETKYKGYLAKHELSHKDRSQTQVYKCLTCSYETWNKTSLKVHSIRHVSSSEARMHKCPECSFVSKYRRSLLRHHHFQHKNLSELQMYKCSTCNFETAHKISFEGHRLKLHGDSSEAQMYKCKTLSEMEYESSQMFTS